MEIYTIGFTRRTAEDFFTALDDAGVRTILDTRLRPDTQLAGFSKARDMPFFTRRLLGARYVPTPILAPTPGLLDGYRRKEISWASYEKEYALLLSERRIGQTLDQHLFEVPTALLCSEFSPEYCHRRLAAEYIARAWPGFEVVHL